MTPLSRLTPENAFIFRVTHRRNVAWLLRHGVWARTAEMQDPGFVTIGNADLIASRTSRVVPISPGGHLDDYVPFYFTPYSPMLLNIVTGRNVPRQAKSDIVILVSSLHEAARTGRAFVFSDRHAYLAAACFSNDLADLSGMVPWSLLQARDFRKDQDDPEKSERYQAEALIFQQLPVTALLGLVAYNEEAANELRALVADQGSELPVEARARWFF